MAIRRSVVATGLGSVAGLALLVLAGCASSGSARTDYFVSRGTSHAAQQGDGSVVAVAPEGGDSTWSASLTYVPILDAGDFADSRR